MCDALQTKKVLNKKKYTYSTLNEIPSQRSVADSFPSSSSVCEIQFSRLRDGENRDIFMESEPGKPLTELLGVAQWMRESSHSQLRTGCDGNFGCYHRIG